MLVAVVLAISAAAMSPLAALAGEPTSTPPATGTPATATPSMSTTPVATPTFGSLAADINGSAIEWERLSGVVRYEVEATADVLRINGSDICAAPLQRDRRQVSITETVGGEVSEVSLGLPDVSPDRWFVVTARFSVRGFDGAGNPIASGGGSFIAETCMRQADPTPARQLPATGTGGGTENNTATVLGAIIATAAATTLVLAGMYGIHRRIRVRDQ